MKEILLEDNGDPMIDLRGYDFVLEPVYFNQGFSNDSRMLLRKSVADKLAQKQKELGKYKFKIWDGYRPHVVQKVIYDKYFQELIDLHPDWSIDKVKEEAKKFVADPYDPDFAPPHSTGGTVDLTLVDQNGKELDMGTVFDHFGPEAEPFYFDKNPGNEIARDNRKILRDAMLSLGFTQDIHEWWHFDYGNEK